MRLRLLLTFLAIIVVPLAVVGWLGARLVRDERVVIDRQFQELLQGQLREISASVSRFIEDREVRLLRATEGVEPDPAAVRARIRDEGLARQIFILDDEGRLVYPSPEGELSQSEREFLERTRDIWIGRHIFYEATPGNVNQLTGPEAALQGRAARRVVMDPTYGWYTWYWGNGINLILWRRQPDGRTVGVEIDRTRLLSDLVGWLPDTDSLDPALPEGRIALVDSRGRIVYQWGGGREPAKETPPAASTALEYPLQAWRLDYYTDTAIPGVAWNGILFNVLSGIAVLALALSGLAVYFYRENSRELREAARRVTFVNQVSHELKTPLTSIRMYAELLENELPDGEEKSKKHLGIIVSESQRLSRLIGNILTFGRSRRKALRLHPTLGVPDDVVSNVLERFRPSLEEKGVAIEFTGDARDEVRFDHDAVEQILGNLLNNVEKYAASGGSMRVATSQNGEFTTVTVSDRGPGIPKRERDRIFQPFHRVGDRLSDGVTGTGIGLSISRELARLHGGDLVLLPSKEGAVFQVTLKKAPSPSGRGQE